MTLVDGELVENVRQSHGMYRIDKAAIVIICKKKIENWHQVVCRIRNSTINKITITYSECSNTCEEREAITV